MSADIARDRAPGREKPLLTAQGLTKHFPLARQAGNPFARRFLHAVDDVNLELYPREIVALVGESGSGKSTVARLLALVYRPTRGEIRFHDQPLQSLRSRRQMLSYRSHVQMVLQDPYSSINAVYPASHGILRSLKLHSRGRSRRAQIERAKQLLDSVGLSPADEFIRKYPHELSGGQRQRIGFAQALACSPELILADEPVSMLDVSIRIGVLNLMAELRNREGVSFLYITHDLASARYIADRVLVMYAGYVVETGPVEDVLSQPKHPYTQLLLASVPDPRAPDTATPVTDLGEPPRVVDPGEGCRFRNRCPYAVARCAEETPRLRLLRHDHMAACHVATADMPVPRDA
ncbi:MAG TPA: ABC transporter ATP-binding protein [Chloroflexota bacterium]|nr:ABC transporter ATP-binding protein [Chloroflexota bacterium]